jgi:hypothetical protein
MADRRIPGTENARQRIGAGGENRGDGAELVG